MTVASEEGRAGPYIGNGVTTVFDFGFRIISEAHLSVVLTEGGVDTVLSLGTQYTVSGAGEAGGGSIHTASPPVAGQAISILRDVPFTQETDLENQGAYFAETVEESFDLAAMRDQQMAEKLQRAVLVSTSRPDAQISIEVLSEDRFWKADASGNMVDGGSVGQITSAAENADIASAAAAAALASAAAAEAAAEAAESSAGTDPSPYDPTWKPSVAARLRERILLSDLADISIPEKFSGALQYAVDNYHHVVIPGRSTKWLMSSGIVIPARPVWIQGEDNPGRDMNGGTLIEYTGAGSAMKTTSGIKAPHFSDFKLYRSGTETSLAAAGLLGIEMPGLVEDACLERLWIEGFYNNVKAGATSYSYMDNVVSNKATQRGILIASNNVANGLQWTLNRCLAQLSGGSGICYDSTGGTGPTSVGEVVNCNSYANSGYGADFLDNSTCKMTGVRLNGGFYGEDRLGGVHIRSHRGMHKLVGVECEIAGTTTTGPPMATQAASNIAWGILLEKPSTYTNGTDFNDALITGGVVAFNTRSGIYSQFANTVISGSMLKGNGAANTASVNSNIQFEGAGTAVSSTVVGNTIISATGWGIFAQNDNHVWTGNVIGGTASTSLANGAGAFSTNGTGTANGVYSGNKTA